MSGNQAQPRFQCTARCCAIAIGLGALLIVGSVYADEAPQPRGPADHQPLKLYQVPVPIRSYRLLSMSMDDDGAIWAGAIHHAIHRYDPHTGQVETVAVPYDLPAASTCLCVGKKVYILGETYAKLIIYDRAERKFSEIAYPSAKPNVWYGTPAGHARYLWLFDRRGSGAIKWDTQTDTPQVIAYPYAKPFPNSGEYVPADGKSGALWCQVSETGPHYVPTDLARLDLAKERFSDYYPAPKDDTGLLPYKDPEHTFFWSNHLRGQIVPFDFRERRFCKFIPVPGFGKKFGFMGGPTTHAGRFYFSLSTYVGNKLGCDGQPYHFCNAVLELDPQDGVPRMLKLETPGNTYYQISYMLSAGGNYFATGCNIREPDGSLPMERTGEILFWQTLKPDKLAQSSP